MRKRKRKKKVIRRVSVYASSTPEVESTDSLTLNLGRKEVALARKSLKDLGDDSDIGLEKREADDARPSLVLV